MTVNKNVRHGTASVMAVRASTVNENVTVVADGGNSERVWVGTDPRVYIYPWYGTPVSAGGSATIASAPGQVVYTASVAEPAAITVQTPT